MKFKYGNPYTVPLSPQQILTIRLSLLLISHWGSCNLRIVSAFKGEESDIPGSAQPDACFLSSHSFVILLAAHCGESILWAACTCALALGLKQTIASVAATLGFPHAD